MMIHNLPAYAYDCEVIIAHDLGDEGVWFYGGYTGANAFSVLMMLEGMGDSNIVWCHGYEAESAD